MKKNNTSFMLFIVSGFIMALLTGGDLFSTVVTMFAVLYVVSASHDKLSLTLLTGCVVTLGYGTIALHNGFYGDAFMNLIVQFSVLIYAIIQGIREKENKIDLFLMDAKVNGFDMFVLWLAIGAILAILGDVAPWLDSFTTTFTIIAVVLLSRGDKRQWYFWVALNGVSIAMWYTNYGMNSMTWMFAFFFINSLFGFFTRNQKRVLEVREI